jgi:hypothetical protein
MGGLAEGQYSLQFPAEAGYPDPRPRIGTSPARLREKLVRTGHLLREVLEPAAAGLVIDALRLLEQQVCRIAVIGQIKAGKSSFINAFVQQPDLLPTDVNPWTTAVTNLHFCSRQEPKNSAVFQFFDAQEWEQLANGGGKLRELAERLVPGFDSDLLQHLAAIKARAVSRLGPELQDLLGRCHRFATLSPDVVQQYVCQGDLTGSVNANPTIGRYSDITKSADIYLPAGPFDYPVTVIDTPGTNDPFLVRDEITRGCLESADLYMVVLTAQQALAPSDVALLRILRGLNKERIIVFLNRIDELTDIAKDTETVVESVRLRLRHEFPGADIPLIPGSALWGNCALAKETRNFDLCVGRRTFNYLQHSGFLQQADFVRPAENDENSSVNFRRALFLASGFKPIYEVLNEFLGGSHYANVLRQVTTCFSELARASENVARQELKSLAQDHALVRDSATRTQDEVSRLGAELRRLKEVSSIIERSAALFSERQMDIVTTELSVLRRRLFHKVDAHSVKERDALADKLLVGTALRTWTFDTQAMRRELEEEFIDGFRRAEAQLLDLQHQIVPHLRHVLAVLMPNARSTAESEIGRHPVPPPAMMALGAATALDLVLTIALDLDNSWWSSWWSQLRRARPTPPQLGREVERIIKTEFRRVVEELINACERNLTDHVVATTKWSFGACARIAESIARRREQLASHYKNLEQKIDGVAGSQAVSEQQHYIEALKRRLNRCEAASRRLESIGRDLLRDLLGARA